MGVCASRPEGHEKDELRNSAITTNSYTRYQAPSTPTPIVTAELPTGPAGTPSSYEYSNSRQTLSPAASTISASTSPSPYNPLSSQHLPSSQVSTLHTGSVRTYQPSVVPSSRIAPSTRSSPPPLSFIVSQSVSPDTPNIPQPPNRAYVQPYVQPLSQKYPQPVTPPPPHPSSTATTTRFCLTPPACRSCGLTGVREVVQSSPTGNKGRPYYHCPDRRGCDDWICFDDCLGVEPGNPRCDCRELSRLQRASPAKGGYQFFKCAKGQCGFWRRQ